MINDTHSQAFFEAKYQKDVDPWDFAGSSYEQERYATILASLNGRRFRRAFEPGCSIGILTERLAAICREVAAIDISAIAISRASERCALLSNTSVRQGKLPEDIPAGKFDLILASEVGYYFNEAALNALTTQLVRHLDKDGVLLAAHWLGDSPDHQLSGDQVHSLIGATPGLKSSFARRYSGFRIDHWIKI